MGVEQYFQVRLVEVIDSGYSKSKIEMKSWYSRAFKSWYLKL